MKDIICLKCREIVDAYNLISSLVFCFEDNDIVDFMQIYHCNIRDEMRNNYQFICGRCFYKLPLPLCGLGGKFFSMKLTDDIVELIRIECKKGNQNEY